MNKRYFRLFTLVLLAAMLVVLLPAAANPVRAQGAKPDKDTLVVAQSVDIESLEPANSNSRAEDNIIHALFGTLYEVNDKGEIVPYLAKSYKYTEDGKGMTFVLNDGLTCHDGEALTAEDVAYTFERAADPKKRGLCALPSCNAQIRAFACRDLALLTRTR